MKHIVWGGVLLLLALTLQAQKHTDEEYKENPYWIEMMQDPTANFYETQKAFNLFWEDREITKGAGWKPFKRWESFWRNRIDAQGNLPAADKNWKAYQQYRSAHARSSNGSWQNLGPIQLPGNYGTGQPNGNGRVNAVAFHPTDPDIIFAGAPAGGLWISEDGGESWISHTDDLPTLGVSAIAIDYNDPEIIYIGTGDRDAGDAQGLGVMRSTDGGVSWQLWNNGMDETTVGRLIMDPTDSEVILAATTSGIFKTTDGGANWTETKNGGFKEIVFHPTNPDIVYAAAGASFYRSSDKGDSWTQVTNGLSTGSRAVIAVTEDQPDYVYVLMGNGQDFNSVNFSTDAGLSFTVQSTSPNLMTWDCSGSGSGGQAWYDLAFAVDPTDANTIYVGGVNIWKSTDKGVSWNINAHWTGDCGVPAVHADHHVFEVNPLNDRIYSGNDGGLYWTDNGGDDWNQITSGLAISQVYKLGQSATVKDFVINGYQDNGTAVFEPSGWATVLGGDGMDCLIDYSDESYSYGEYYYGQIVRMHNNYYDGGITSGISQDGNWVTPYILHESDPNTMFVGMSDVWRTKNVKENFVSGIEWENISNGMGSGNCDVLESNKANPDILYVGKSSQLYRTDNVMDDAVVFTTLTSNVPGSGSINDIETHPTNENIVYITKGDMVYASYDKGLNWEDISGSLPEVNMNTIEYYVNGQGSIYVGSDVGIFFREEGMDDWIDFNDGFPATATVTDLEFYYEDGSPAEDRIRVSTYGRGLWDSDVYYGVLTANFEASELEIPTDCTVDFTDLSTGVPHSWAWEFEGGSPATSTDKNPEGIAYHEEGTYSVTLTVSNPTGENTQTFTDYITVSGSLLPEADFTASATSFCSGEYAVVELYDNSSYCPASWQWIFEPSTITYLEGTDENSPNPVVQFNADGNYDVTMVVTNTAGSSTLEREDYIAVGGITPPFSEDFEVADALNQWEITNPDGGITWESYNINGNNTVRMNHRAYLVPPGDRDQLISPTLDFTGMDDVYLHFRHAYARFFTGATDSLIVKISEDCGENWTRLFAAGEDGSGNFATAESAGVEFVPQTDAEWCGAGFGSSCNTIDLTDYADMQNIKIMFESYNYYNNNLYLDDIIVNNSPFTDLENVIDTPDFSVAVYPNPAQNQVNIVMNGVDEEVVLMLTSVDGKSLISRKASAAGTSFAEQLNVENIPDGIYFVRILGNNIQETKKLIIRR